MTRKERKAAEGMDCTLRVASYLGLPCALPETTVLCHAPCRDKGVGYKSPDRWAAFGCSTCHDLMDDRNNQLTIHQKREGWLRGIYETQKILGVFGEAA